jgi:hypothetical protein
MEDIVDDLEQLFRQLGKTALLFRPWSVTPEQLIEQMLDVYNSLILNNQERYQCFPTAQSFQRYLELEVGTPTNRAFFRRRIMQYIEDTSKAVVQIFAYPMATGSMLWIHFAVPQRPHDHEAELLECNKSFLEEDFGGDFDYSRIFDDENVETAYGKSMRHDFERFCILYMYSSVVSIQSTNVDT